MGTLYRWHDGNDMWHLDAIDENGDAHMIADNIVGEDRAMLFEQAEDNAAELAALRERVAMLEGAIKKIQADAACWCEQTLSSSMQAKCVKCICDVALAPAEPGEVRP